MHKMIEIEKIETSYNPRIHYDDIAFQDLKQSIEERGLIVPIKVKKKDNGNFELVYGERRLRACTELEWKEIPAIIEDISEDKAIIAKGIENITRGNLHFIEEGLFFKKILDGNIDDVKTQKQLAKVFGIAQQGISFKIDIVSHLYPLYNSTNISKDPTNISKDPTNISKDINGALFHLNFGLLHALELTKLHHVKIVIETRKEGDKKIDLFIEDLLKETIDDVIYRKIVMDDFIEKCETTQLKMINSIIENGPTISTVKKQVISLVDGFKTEFLDFIDEERNKKCWYRDRDENKGYGVVFFKDARVMLNDIDKELEEPFDTKTRKIRKCHLIVTSPPYFADKEYEKELSFEGYSMLLTEVFEKCYEVLCPDGLICINIGDIIGEAIKKIPDYEGSIYYISTLLNQIMTKIGFIPLSKIIWKKDDPWFNNPQIKYEGEQGKYKILPSTEYIFIYKKEGKRLVDEKLKTETMINGLGLSKDEWITFVSGFWTIPSVRSNDEHPAIFPDELVRRLIKMYSFKGDVILDPFLGSGTTVKVARELNRHGIGYEINEERYKEIIQQKIV